MAEFFGKGIFIFLFLPIEFNTLKDFYQTKSAVKIYLGDFLVHFDIFLE